MDKKTLKTRSGGVSQPLPHRLPRKIILASASPRRKEILRQLGIRFETRVSRIQEQWHGSSDPVKVAVELATRKVRKCKARRSLIIGMDTVVVVGKKILGKPADAAEAKTMLRTLSHRTHSVITGLALKLGNQMVTDFEETRVTFRAISAPEMEWYLSSGEPFDKAGAYAIQGLGRIFVRKIEGCYFNVVGFPIGCFQRALNQLGLTIHDLM